MTSHVPDLNNALLSIAMPLCFYPLFSSLAMGVRGGVFTLTFARLNLRLRNHLFRTLMRQEIAFFDENHTGEIGTSSIHPSM